MPIFADLTSDQQAQIITFMGLFRQRVGNLAHDLAALAQLDLLYQANIIAPVTSLDAGTVIPDTNPTISGAVRLPREQILALMTVVETVLTNFNAPANQINFIKVAGMQ